MRKIKRKIRKCYKHGIAIAITLCFMALAIFVFPKGIIRIKESFVDLFWSCAYYINVLFEFDDAIPIHLPGYEIK